MFRRIFILVLFLIFLALGSYFYTLQPKNRNNITSSQFEVRQGEGLRSIAARLQSEGFIKNQYSLLVFAYLNGQATKLHAGTFDLSPSLSVKSIVSHLLTSGSVDRWVRLEEGSRREEMANYFKANNFYDYRQFLKLTTSLEGKIFPDSYLVPQKFDLNQFLELVSQNFSKKIEQSKEGRTTNLTDDQTIILASLLEREGRSLESKKMIAGILLNRLDIDMALQVDATVQYAVDSRSSLISDYWRPVSKSDLSINSPFNTYLHPGLPPAPICNPSLNSLIAAYHPTSSDYLYYITGLDGKMYYAKTYEQHQINIENHLK